MNSCNDIIAVIVLYYPDKQILSESIKVISSQVKKIILVDNTPIKEKINLGFFNDFISSKIILVSLGENYGIGYAQNIGIELAINEGADLLLFLDQDSIPHPEMLGILHFSYKKKLNFYKNTSLAGVGPLRIDRRNGTKSKFRSKFLYNNFQSFFSRLSKKNINVNFLISSGLLVSKETLLIVRGMRSNYFIEHVDTEWCKRVSNFNFYLLGEKNAFLYHSIGDKVKKIWLFYYRNINIHSPIRNYYVFRNTILMFKDGNLTILERTFHIIRLIQIFLILITIENEKLNRFQMIYLGIKHGLMRVSGKFNPETGKCEVIPPTLYDPNN